MCYVSFCCIDYFVLFTPTGDDEIELRALAIVAGDQIVAAAAARGLVVTAAQVDSYFWTLAKEGEMRKLPRHSTPDTIFY